MIADAQTTLGAHAQREWLPWAGKRFLPALSHQVEQEAAAEQSRLAEAHQDGLRRQAEQRNEARATRRAARTEEARRQKAALNDEYKAKRITARELFDQTGTIEKQLDADNKADESDGEDEVMEVDDDDDRRGEEEEGADKTSTAEEDDDDDDAEGAAPKLPAICIPGGKTKRKRAETPEGELVAQIPKVRRSATRLIITQYKTQSSQCDRCVGTTGPDEACMMAPGGKRCRKCTVDKKGCLWGGTSRTGTTRGRRETRTSTKKATEGRGARKGKDAAEGKGKAKAVEQPEKRPAKAPRRTFLLIRKNTPLTQSSQDRNRRQHFMSMYPGIVAQRGGATKKERQDDLCLRTHGPPDRLRSPKNEPSNRLRSRSSSTRISTYRRRSAHCRTCGETSRNESRPLGPISRHCRKCCRSFVAVAVAVVANCTCIVARIVRFVYRILQRIHRFITVPYPRL